jgi:hypothetical protein
MNYSVKIDKKSNSYVVKDPHTNSPRLPKVRHSQNKERNNGPASNIRSIEHEDEVKDYFDNKISLRRSIE